MQSIHVPSPTNPQHNTKSLADLEKFTLEHASRTIDTLDEFAKYWNEFDSIARSLIEGKIITKAERDLYFWTGLPYSTRKSIGLQLATTELCYNERLIPTWRDAIQAGRLIFDLPSASMKQDNDIDKLVRTLHGLNVDDSNYAVAYARLLVAAPTVADRIQPPLRWSRSSSNNRNLSVPHSSTHTPILNSTSGSAPYRPTLRRVQSYITYQWCPSCVDQRMTQKFHGA